MQNCSHAIYSSPNRLFLWVLTISAIVAGVYLRLKGLDKAPFTIDEYYIAASVQNILERGFPEFGCGGFYTRGLLYQYMLAPLFAYGSNNELYARLVTVASNILTAPALYLLAKQVSGKTVAYIVIVLFFLSVWEIEFSRFARMYAPFQMIFIWHIYFLHKWVFGADKNAKAWCYALSLLSIFVYEGGIFLVLLNFLPILIDRKYFHKPGIAINLAILAVAYFYLTTNFRVLGVDTVSSSANSKVILPPIMASSISSRSLWFAVFLFLSSILIYWGIKSIKQIYDDRTTAEIIYKIIFIILLILFALLNAYMLILSTIGLALALNWITLKEFSSRKFLPIIIPITLMLGFWITYGLLSDTWANSIDPESYLNTKQVLIALFEYPDIYNKIFYILFQAMPVFTVITGFILLLGFVKAISTNYKGRKDFLFIIAIVLGLILCVAILRQRYTTTRYIFFLYPLIILLVAMTAQHFAQLLFKKKRGHSFALFGFAIAFMIVTEDYNLKHYFNIDSEDILYRNHYNIHMENHLYARWDFRTPAEIVNKHRMPGDTVITSTYATPYYLEHLDYFYNDANRANFHTTTGCEGQINIRTNVKQFSRPKDILDLLSKADNTVWIIARSSNYRWQLPIEETLETKYTTNKIYQTVDGNLNVYKIP